MNADDAAAGPAGGTLAGPGRLSLVVLSGDFARVHYALVLAAGQAALGRAATLFFTLAATRALLQPDDTGSPGWHRLAAGAGRGAAAVDDDYRARGIAGFEELLSACAAMGVRFIVCEMGLRAEGLARADLRADLPIDAAGVVTLLTEDASGGTAWLVL